MPKKRDRIQKREEKLFLKFMENSLTLKEWDIISYKVKKTGNDFRIKTHRGERVLKTSLDKNRVLFMYYTLEYLAQRGYSFNLPRLMPTKYGDQFAVRGGKIYYLNDWFEGKKCQRKKIDHVIAAVKCLARFHVAGKGFIPPCESRERWFEFPDQMINRLKNIERKLVELPDSLVKAWNTLKDLALKSREIIELPDFNRLLEKAKRERTVCHRQFSPRNVLIGRNYSVSVLNWEHCAFGVQITDLSYFMNKVMPASGWNFVLGEKIIETYHRIKPLTREEYLVLAASLMFPTSFFRLVEKFQLGKVEKTKVSSKLAKIMEGEKQKTAFLEAFFEHHGVKIPFAGEKRDSEIISYIWYCANQSMPDLEKKLDRISCLIPLSFTITQEGKLCGDVDQGLCKEASKQEIPLIPAVYSLRTGDDLEIISRVLSEPALRNTVIQEISNMLEDDEFLGVNINFPLNGEQKKDFHEFLEQLSEITRKRGKLLLTSVSAGHKDRNNYDYQIISRLSDYIMVEIFDEPGRGSVASKQFVRDSLDYALSLVPGSQVIPVLPVYGYRWVGSHKVLKPVGFKETEEIMASNGQLSYDTERGSLWGKFVINGAENQIWGENAQSFDEKLALIDQSPVGGHAFWRMGLEDPRIWSMEAYSWGSMSNSLDENEEDDEDDE